MTGIAIAADKRMMIDAIRSAPAQRIMRIIIVLYGRVPLGGAAWHALLMDGIIALMGTIVAVDIGGTHLRGALYEPDNTQPIVHQRVESRASKPGVYGRMEALIESIWPKDREVMAIGIASPGPLDPHTGYILKTPNIAEWQNFPLAPKLKEHFHVPAYLDTDANLA